MKYIITGSEGFIGSALKQYLDSKFLPYECYDLKLHRPASWVLPKKDDIVIHLAASTSVFNEKVFEIAENNILTFMDVVHACNQVGCKLVYASSSTATDPTSMYGLSKKFDEDYAKIYAPDAVGLRFYNVYSETPRKDTLLAKLLEGNCTLYNNGENARHFTYVGDIIQGIMKATELPGGVYTICNPEYMTCKEFADLIPDITYTLSPQKRTYDREFQIFDPDTVMDLEYTPVRNILPYIQINTN